jgi:hypothetical protein
MRVRWLCPRLTLRTRSSFTSTTAVTSSVAPACSFVPDYHCGRATHVGTHMAHAHPPAYAVPLTLCLRLAVPPWPVRRWPLTCGGSSVQGTADLSVGYTKDMRTQNALRWCPALLSETRPSCHHHNPNLGILDLGAPSVGCCRFPGAESRVVQIAQIRRYKHIGCLAFGR